MNNVLPSQLTNRVSVHEFQVAEELLEESEYSFIACAGLRAQYRESVNIVPELWITSCMTLGKISFQVLRVLICKMNRLDKLIIKVIFIYNILGLYGLIFHLSW